MRYSKDRQVATAGRKRPDKVTETGARLYGSSPSRLRSLLPSLMTAVMVATAGLLLTPALGKAQAQPQPRLVQIGIGKNTSSVSVVVGKSENVRTDTSFIDVVVSDPETADVLPLTDKSLSVLGKKIGGTRVTVYAEGKKLVGVFDVEVSYDTTKLSSEISRQFPNSGIKVTSANGRIMLTGTSPDGVTLNSAMTIAKQFGPDVINSVKVLQPQQVLLEVRFVEASRTAGRELGIRWDSVAKNLTANVGTAGLLSGNTPFGVIVGSLLKGGVDADVIIKSLEERGVARRLAEPNLVALSGDTASFLAGGEFPFPVASALNQISVEFKKFGVGLAFTPTVLSNGVINLKIEPEVSQLDPTNVVRVGGIDIPSLIVRRANTTIELRDGQSFAIAGLLQSTNATDAQQLPWLGNIPVLGALFRSASYQKKETDLAIIVTPHIVRPTRPGDMVKTPLDNTLPSNDIDFFVHGRHELTAAMADDPWGNLAVAGNAALSGIAKDRPFAGHVLDLPQEDTHVALQ
jgi:pilus assembly protein CpaC